MSPPPPPLPVPSFLERAPGPDPEVRAWVAAAYETISALRDEVVAATARAEAAERRLSAVDDAAPGGSGPPAPLEGQARLQAATDAAAAVIAEARVVLREVREGRSSPGLPPQGLSLPRPALTPPSPVAASSVPDPPPVSSPEPTPPPTAAPPVPASPPGPGHSDPPSAVTLVPGSSPEPSAAPTTEQDAARADDPDRRIAVSQPPKLDAGSPMRPPSAAPVRDPKPLLTRLLDRRRRR